MIIGLTAARDIRSRSADVPLADSAKGWGASPRMMVVVSGPGEAQRSRRNALPPLAEEDYACMGCGLRYAVVTVEQAVDVIRALPAAVREAVRCVPTEARSIRPESDQWSVTEYVCHLRDVYVTYTIRLHRARTEDQPVLEPMLNDLRVRRFRYNESDVEAVLEELAAAAAGFCDEVARNRPEQWNRLVTRLPGEVRTARWLVRQAMHEGRHHLADIFSIAAAVAARA